MEGSGLNRSARGILITSDMIGFLHHNPLTTLWADFKLTLDPITSTMTSIHLMPKKRPRGFFYAL